MGISSYIREKKAAFRQRQIETQRMQAGDRKKEIAQLREIHKFEKEKATLRKEEAAVRALRSDNRKAKLSQITEPLRALRQKAQEKDSPFSPRDSQSVRDVFGSGGSNPFYATTAPPKRQEKKRKSVTVHIDE